MMVACEKRRGGCASGGMQIDVLSQHVAQARRELLSDQLDAAQKLGSLQVEQQRGRDPLEQQPHVLQQRLVGRAGERDATPHSCVCGVPVGRPGGGCNSVNAGGAGLRQVSARDPRAAWLATAADTTAACFEFIRRRGAQVRRGTHAQDFQRSTD